MSKGDSLSIPAKKEFELFCRRTYVPIWSLPWWMDAICGSENWDVWLYRQGGEAVAAMPYYREQRGKYQYITKAPLTQNNGLIVKYPADQQAIRRAHFEEEIVEAANQYIESLGIDVYEQQYHYSFQNFLPHFWNHYKIIPRVTYVIENTSDMAKIENGMASNYRKAIKKGMKYIARFAEIPPERFFYEHEKIYLRQGLPCPFSFSLWMRLFDACNKNDAGKIITAQKEDGTVLSLMFLVWDSASAYLLMGGAVPEFSSLQTYTALVHECIAFASSKGLQFDFEGSVIRRINHSFREYGGVPKTYYRIRKVFSPDIVRKEAEEELASLEQIKG